MSFLDLIGSEFSFEGANGKTYKLVPLSLVEWGDFVTWVQYKPYRDAKIAGFPKYEVDAIKELCRSGLVKEIVDGEEKEFPINIGSTCVRKALSTLEGVGKITELSFIAGQPEFKDKPLGHILNLAVVNEIQRQVLQQNGLLSDNNKVETIDTSPEGTDAKKKIMNQ